MTASNRNLCATVENHARYETLRCSFVRQCKPPYQHIETSYHEWPDRAGGVTGCTCVHCGKTLKQVRVRINPKTGQPVRRSSLAREIALTQRDVPPVVFVGAAR